LTKTLANPGVGLTSGCPYTFSQLCMNIYIIEYYSIMIL